MHSRIHIALRVLVALMVLSIPALAHITGEPVPELNPATMAGAVAILAGGLLVLRDRWRRK